MNVPSCQQNFQMGKLSRLGYKIAIHRKTLVLACLKTYTANRQGHNSWENIRDQMKNHESFPSNILSYMV